MKKTEVKNRIKSLEIMKYKSFEITKTPSRKFQEKVTITKSKSTLKNLVGKSFINLKSVMIFIENELSEELIRRNEKYVQRQLRTIGLGCSYC